MASSSFAIPRQFDEVLEPARLGVQLGQRHRCVGRRLDLLDDVDRSLVIPERLMDLGEQ